jgi:hypothetical protein
MRKVSQIPPQPTMPQMPQSPLPVPLQTRNGFNLTVVTLPTGPGIQVTYLGNPAIVLPAQLYAELSQALYQYGGAVAKWFKQPR